jgi:hypothetical protein
MRFPYEVDTCSIEDVTTNFPRSAVILRAAAFGLLAAVAAGCWKEIHYTPPAADTEAKSEILADRAERTSPRVVSNDAQERTAVDVNAESPAAGHDDFADDLASSLPLEAAPAENQYPKNSPPPEEESDNLFGGIETDEEPTKVEMEAPAPPIAEAENRPAVSAAETKQKTRRMAWLLGSKLSLAAFQNDRGAPAHEVTKWFDQSRSLAQQLGVSVGDFPARSDASGTGGTPSQALDYLFDEGRKIGRTLALRHGDVAAALFELAVKSNVLLALYQPGAPIAGALAEAIRQSSERARLPAELTQPLLDQLASGATAAEVQDAVFSLHVEIDRYLSAAADP